MFLKRCPRPNLIVRMISSSPCQLVFRTELHGSCLSRPSLWQEKVCKIKISQRPCFQYAEGISKMGCNMRIMVLLLLCHLDRFPDNLGDINANKVKDSTKMWKGWKRGIRAEKRDFPHNKHTRNSMKRKFLSHLTIG